MSGVKLFDLNRLAKFENKYSGEPVYFVPGDIVSLVEYKSGDAQLSRARPDFDRIRVSLSGDVELDLCATLEEFEAEINRALGATRDSMKAYEEELAKHLNDKLRALQHDVDEQKQEAAFSQNDFCPNLGKDKKGVN